jgi:Spy/CpxP family protein refolding chaperone
MSLRRKLTGVGLTLGLSLTISSVAFAQQQSAPSQQDGQQQGQWERRGKHRGMGKRGGGIMRVMGQLNLTDAQQQQLRAIEERFKASTKTQREELRRLHEGSQGQLSADAEARLQALRAEMGEARRGIHQEMLNVLTQEQRTQLEQLMRERKARHGERRGRPMNQQDNNDDQ